jgi:hypothetical protein
MFLPLLLVLTACDDPAAHPGGGDTTCPEGDTTCPGGDGTCPGVADSTCPAEGGATFDSVEEGECGLGPDGVVLCTWVLGFEADGTWHWSGSDYGRSGDWSCGEDGLVVTAGGAVLDLQWAPERCTLTFEGVEYVAR